MLFLFVEKKREQLKHREENWRIVFATVRDVCIHNIHELLLLLLFDLVHPIVIGGTLTRSYLLICWILNGIVMLDIYVYIVAEMQIERLEIDLTKRTQPFHGSTSIFSSIHSILFTFSHFGCGITYKSNERI